jgi:hypothetical protein
MTLLTEAHVSVLKQQFNKGQLIVLSGQSENLSPLSYIGFPICITLTCELGVIIQAFQ